MRRNGYRMALAAFLAAATATAAAAQTDMDKALADGAQRMTGDQIAERLAGTTVTFENAASGARALIFYDGENGAVIRPVGSSDTIPAFYAVDLADHVCLGMAADTPIRLRCMSVLLVDGMMVKFELDGSLRGRVIEEAAGNGT